MKIADIPFVTLIHATRCSAADAVSVLNRQLVERGFTAPEYRDAVVERELVFPTGLPTVPPVAIPHADPDFVHQTAAALGIFREPIEFLEMGNPDNKLRVHLVFMLALTEKEAAVELLGQLTRVFRHSEDLYHLQAAQTAGEATTILNQMIKVIA